MFVQAARLQRSPLHPRPIDSGPEPTPLDARPSALRTPVTIKNQPHTVHSGPLPSLYPRYPILKHQPLRTHRALLLPHTRLPDLARAHPALEKTLRSDEEDIRARLPAAHVEQAIVRAHDALPEAPEQRAVVRALERKVAPLRARSERERHAVRVQVPHEAQRARQRLHGRPARVLQSAPRGEVVLDREGGREVREEGEEVLGGFALGWGPRWGGVSDGGWGVTRNGEDVRLPMSPALMSQVISLPYGARSSSAGLVNALGQHVHAGRCDSYS